MRRAVRGGECAPPLLGHVAGPQAPSGRPAPEPLEAAFLTLLQRKLSWAQPCRSRNGVFKAAASAFCDPQCDIPERGPPLLRVSFYGNPAHLGRCQVAG